MEWFRVYHGISADDKWPLIARRSGQPVAYVVAVWIALLECASSAEDRGSIARFDPESVDAQLQMPEGAAQSIVDALSCGMRPRIVAGRIVNWEKRQPVREDSSAERTRKWRERKEARRDASETQVKRDGDAPVTHGDADETRCDAPVTPRLEKRREEKTRLNTPPLPPAGGSDGDDPPLDHNTQPRAGKQEPPGFPDFWQAYPKKTGKNAAAAAWQKARDRPALAVILAAVERQKTWPQWLRDGGQYIPNPATWINQGRWNDEPPDVQARASPSEKTLMQRQHDSTMEAFRRLRDQNARVGNP
jgi:hypothetical protein